MIPKKRCRSPADSPPPSNFASVLAQPVSEKRSGSPVSVSPKKLMITNPWLMRSIRLKRWMAWGLATNRGCGPCRTRSMLERTNHRMECKPKNPNAPLITMMK